MNTCPYCGEEFETEQKKGEHLAAEHVDSDSSIPRKSRNESRTKDITRKWEAEEGSQGG